MNLVELKGNHIVDLDRINENSMVIDAGACKGEVMENFPVKCHFIAIESNKTNYRALKQLPNLVFAKSIKIVNGALVGKKRMVDFYEVEGRPEWGSISGINGGQYAYSVEGVVLDDYPEADYIKMDIEGTELEVIQNLPYNPSQMSIETHGNKGELIKELKKRGYKIKEYPHNEVYAYL